MPPAPEMDAALAKPTLQPVAQFQVLKLEDVVGAFGVELGGVLDCIQNLAVGAEMATTNNAHHRLGSAVLAGNLAQSVEQNHLPWLERVGRPLEVSALFLAECNRSARIRDRVCHRWMGR